MTEVKDGVQGCLECGEPLEHDDFLVCYWCHCKKEGIGCKDRECYSKRLCGPACKHWEGKT